MSKKSILNKKSMQFLEKYLNNASPTGYEWEGQKIWMDYLKPYATYNRFKFSISKPHLKLLYISSS